MKLAFLLSFWELLQLMFNLPYLKWLYFTSLVVLVPYTDYISVKTKRRIKAIMIAIVLFILIMIVFYGNYSILNLLNLNISTSTITMIFLLLLVFLAVRYYRDSLKRIISLSLLSLISSVSYLPVQIAVSLKISSLIFVVIASILTGLHLFDKIATTLKAGVIVPITGFAHSMTSAAMDYRNEGLINGIGSNIFKLAGSIILYGVVSAIILALIKGVIL